MNKCWISVCHWFAPVFWVLVAGCFENPIPPNVNDLICRNNQGCPTGYECKILPSQSTGRCCKDGICPANKDASRTDLLSADLQKSFDGIVDDSASKGDVTSLIGDATVGDNSSGGGSGGSGGAGGLGGTVALGGSTSLGTLDARANTEGTTDGSNIQDVPACQPKPRDCSSGNDNDCNGKPDNQEIEFCACTVGKVQPCQEHPGIDGKGICLAGQQACEISADKITSAWSKTCKGSIGPTAELCDPEQKDENCDGQANEGCLANGATCSLGTQCATGVCAGTTCCDRSCTGLCEQCTVATKGLCTYKQGTVCSTETDCFSAATCSGSSSTCPSPVPKSKSTLCGAPPTCLENSQSASYCDGSGTCGSRTNKACGLFACTTGTGCKSSCTANVDCVGSTSVFCGASGTCITNSACWRDVSTNLLWQVDADPTYYYPSDAQAHCSGLTLCGLSGWYVPDLDQLRSLIVGCPSTQTGGICSVSNSCLGDACDPGGNCSGCDTGFGLGAGGCYQPSFLTGPCFYYWSSSSYTSNIYGTPTTRYRAVNFTAGGVLGGDPTDKSFVRCVR